ncbi:MAG: glutamine--fructose-6-phosphate aminotransferase, partial [Chlamydiia bacterium]|nr:glutamine--fructose-6-phosphate aminotransferase [Chlamydiia bacterium]
MCGIFGYIRSSKNKQSPVDVCINGLKLLEYRGYDSSGIAGVIDGKIRACKRAGKVHALQTAVAEEKIELSATIAHTRWATHGIPNEENAHPHLDERETLAVVHNGIIENYNMIRNKLMEKGIVFLSDTDTEVIAALISHYYQGNLRLAVQKAMKELQGSFAIAVIHKDHPNEMVGASRESPLVVGIDPENGEAYLSSDANSFNGKVLDILYLKDDEVITLKPDAFTIYNSHGKKIEKELKRVAFEDMAVSKNGYDHYMLKEIFEQPQTIQQAMVGRFK